MTIMTSQISKRVLPCAVFPVSGSKELIETLFCHLFDMRGYNSASKCCPQIRMSMHKALDPGIANCEIKAGRVGGLF